MCKLVSASALDPTFCYSPFISAMQPGFPEWMTAFSNLLRSDFLNPFLTFFSVLNLFILKPGSWTSAQHLPRELGRVPSAAHGAFVCFFPSVFMKLVSSKPCHESTAQNLI